MASWIAIIVVTIIAIVFIIVFPLAKIFLKSKYAISSSSDRGIKKFKDAKNGVGILFVPALTIRKYMSQYILYEKGAHSYFYGKIADDIDYIDFDIVAFDDENKIIKVLQVKELIEKKGNTSLVNLPEGTSYITIVLNQVNNEKLEKTQTSVLDWKRVIPFFSISTLLMVGECFIIKYCLSQMMAGIYRELFNNSATSIVITIAIGIGLGLLSSAAIYLGLKIKSKKG